MTSANRQRLRAHKHLANIAEKRFMGDMGAGVVALSPDHPTLVQWRYFQRNCVCSVVTEANRQAMLRQMHTATDTLGRVIQADVLAYAQNLFCKVQRAEHRSQWAQLAALDIDTLDTSQAVAECVQTCVLVAAP